MPLKKSMSDKMKKILKIIAAITCFESIAGFVVVIALIAGVWFILEKTSYNLLVGIPACIVFVFVVMGVYWKIEKKLSEFFKTK